MSIESDLFAAIAPIFSNRFHPVIFPQSQTTPVWPSARYTIISSVPVADSCGDGADTNPDLRVQIDVVSTTYVAMRTLRTSVIAAMATFSPPAILENSLDTYDDETKTYRAILDYVIYVSSP